MLNFKYTEIGIFAGIALMLGMFCTFSFFAPRTSLMNMDSTRTGMDLGYYDCVSHTGEYYTMCDSRKTDIFGGSGKEVSSVDMSYNAYKEGQSGVQPMYLFTVCILAFVLLAAFNGNLTYSKLSLFILGGCAIIGIIGVIGAKLIFGTIISLLLLFATLLMYEYICHSSYFCSKKDEE